MTVREEFEEWWRDHFGASTGPAPNHWPVWQAAYAAGQESMRAKLDEQWNDGFDKGKAAGRKAGLEEALGTAMEWTEAARKDKREFGVGMDIAAAIRALKAG